MARSGSNTRQRQHVLACRLDDAELAQVSISGSTSEWLRRLVLSASGQVLTTTQPDDKRTLGAISESLSALRYEARRLGNNLNQYTHHANATGGLAAKGEVAALADAIKGLQEAVEALVAGHQPVLGASRRRRP